jgi:hypothetical protein
MRESMNDRRLTVTGEHDAGASMLLQIANQRLNPRKIYRRTPGGR